MSSVMRKLSVLSKCLVDLELKSVKDLDLCICENKGADELRSNCAADQHLYFRYIDSTIPLLPK